MPNDVTLCIQYKYKYKGDNTLMCSAQHPLLTFSLPQLLKNVCAR